MILSKSLIVLFAFISLLSAIAIFQPNITAKLYSAATCHTAAACPSNISLSKLHW